MGETRTFQKPAVERCRWAVNNVIAHADCTIVIVLRSQHIILEIYQLPFVLVLQRNDNDVMAECCLSRYDLLECSFHFLFYFSELRQDI